MYSFTDDEQQDSEFLVIINTLLIGPNTIKQMCILEKMYGVYVMKYTLVNQTLVDECQEYLGETKQFCFGKAL